MMNSFYSILLSLLLAFPLCMDAQKWTSSPEGQVYDSVFCQKHPDHSYALFLPPDFDSTKSYPAIFIFEPAARGRFPIDSFRQAAARYGYLLACSNKLSNGPWQKSFEGYNEIMEDLHLRFHLLPSRIYTSGFSGGSRAALAVASLSDEIAGVIGCGAAQPPPAQYQPKAGDHFAYIGLVGDKDMNYLEMHDLEKKLLGLGMPACLRIFPAGHQWPPASVISDALAWLELQAMEKSLLENDPAFVQKQFEKMAQQAQKLRSAEDWTEAARFYQYLSQDFPQHPDLATYQKEQQTLLASKNYQKAKKLWDKNKEKEEGEREIFLKAFDKIIFSSGNMPDSIRSWWKQELNSLNSLSKSKKQANSLMAFRLLNMITATCIEWGQGRMALNQYSTAASLYDIWGLAQPESRFPFYWQARAYALDGRASDAYKALEKAVKLGMSRRDVVEKDPAFSGMREEQRFQGLLEEMGGG